MMPSGIFKRGVTKHPVELVQPVAHIR